MFILEFPNCIGFTHVIQCTVKIDEKGNTERVTSPAVVLTGSLRPSWCR